MTQSAIYFCSRPVSYKWYMWGTNNAIKHVFWVKNVINRCEKKREKSLEEWSGRCDVINELNEALIQICMLFLSPLSPSLCHFTSLWLGSFGDPLFQLGGYTFSSHLSQFAVHNLNHIKLQINTINYI